MNNMVGIVGYLEKRSRGTKIMYGKQLYTVVLTTVRKNGVTDKVMVMVPKEAIKKWNKKSIFDAEQKEKIMVIGRMQTHRDIVTGKCRVFVYADYIAPTGEHAEIQNDVRFKGVLSENPRHRENAEGYMVTDMIVMVDSAFRPEYCAYIPVVVWNEGATSAFGLRKGQTVEVCGRYQSRNYTKRLEDGTAENRTAFEVSARWIKGGKRHV